MAGLTVFILSLVYFSTIVSTSGFPDLEFNCSRGQIQNIFGVGIQEQAVVIDFRNGTMCHISDGTCKWQNMYQKLYVMYDKKETNSKIVAGRPYYYELECQSGGYVARATAVPFVVGSTSPSYMHKVLQVAPSYRPGIVIKINKDKKELSAAVHLGELLSLTIKGPANTRVIPMGCNAASKNYLYLLWNNTVCRSFDQAIMEDTWTLANESISIDMYAFRFVDSSIVTIECSAFICPSSDSACISAVNTCQPKSDRRRRSSNIETHHQHKYNEDSSSVSFTVADSFVNANGSEGVSWDIILYLTAVIITMCGLGRE
ncbi:uncharacterized protein LOC143074564 [Mytilus galloprovincialis]|uniref:uncharacterized protein LOC143074564 n=1 Tax=Mytilus galloprovincialis TaxID=29158 RepID=UPI003F7BC3E0